MRSSKHNTHRTSIVAAASGGGRPGPLRALFTGAAITGAMIAVVSFGACRKNPETEPVIEAVDVEPALVIGTEDDPTAVVRPPALVGILPEDFPDGLPLYLPASLIDFGTADDGWVFVNLLTPHSFARVERELSAKLIDHGWTTAGGTGRLLRKGSSRVRLRVEDARPGTRYRYEYPG